MKLSQAIEQLAIATRTDGRSPRTVQAYREKLGHLVTFLGDVQVENITVHELRLYVSALWDANYSPFTVSSRVRHFKRLFNFLVEEGILESSPARRIKTPKPKRNEPKGISHQDFLTLLENTKTGALEDLRDRAIIFFLADTGCRVKGLCGLLIEKVDFDKSLAYVIEKGEKGRYVPFMPETAQALQDWLEARPQVKSGFVFIGLRGRSKDDSISESGILQMLKRRAKRAGIEGPVNPHSFRHGFARDYLKSGGDLASLADLMGHSDIKVTKEWYGVFTIGDLQEKHSQHSPIAQLFKKDNDGDGQK